MSPAPAAILFDLDGTLVDTAPDLARALNAVRGDDGLEPIPLAAIRPYVSHGSYALIRLGFDYGEKSAEFESRRQRLLDFYHRNVACESRLFDGMEAVLGCIEASARPWGIVTNKPGWLTTPLVQALELERRAACVISGDSTASAKPHPQPLLAAAQQIGVAPARCLYVGDAERDVAAAVAAGMPVLIALYGYIGADDDPHSWGGAGMLQRPQDLTDWL